MSKYVISEPQFLKVFDKLMQRRLVNLTKKTSQTHKGWFFSVDKTDHIIIAYIPFLNTVEVHNELFYTLQSTFDLTLSAFKKLIQKWLSENLKLPEDVKVEITG